MKIERVKICLEFDFQPVLGLTRPGIFFVRLDLEKKMGFGS